MEIGAVIRKARTERKLTQEQAAEALGVSRQTVSNWETGRSFPDIISVLRMSDLYAVSLDALLKEENTVNNSYRDYLAESTDTVRSRERQAKLLLTLVNLGLWALGVGAFWFANGGERGPGLLLQALWVVLPVSFFAASFIAAARNWLGGFRWSLPPVFGVLYALTGYIAFLSGETEALRAVNWPDLNKLLIGLVVSLAGVLLGDLYRKKEKRKNDAESAV